MTVTTSIPPDLIAAYRATEYRVLSPTEFTLRIGQASADLMALYAAHGVSNAAFLTAWNPFSERTDPEVNASYQNSLRAKITESGFSPYAGFGVDPSGQWAGEDSIFVLGIDRDHASMLGTEFGQNAIVWIGADAIPELVLLR